MTEHELRCRTSLLATLVFHSCLSVPILRREMENVHGLPMSADLIRSDLAWLTEMGLIEWNGEVAMCTERGKDVGARRAKFPGQA